MRAAIRRTLVGERDCLDVERETGVRHQHVDGVFRGGERVELPPLGLSPAVDGIHADVPMTGRS